MARIAGINIPDKKKISVALTYIYGIGHPAADKILDTAKVSKKKRASELSVQEINRIRGIIEKQYMVEGVLRRKVLLHIKRLKDIGTYRGMRHIKNLPVRGQRTKTNSRTRHGNVRRTMGSGKRKMEKK
ncbi:MAG: 30S ribosomal protein S13 [Candidatus Ryanbacteria bacterium RIFCSPHIGHO2_02_FULL_45_43]|uniref:Small ribosomal subunit protein uS13 n=1 Tax=Candidatus Ryanbacteria bacterium RIFCSPHIGHO2_01_45_13 TaxID=1802112 RepID=A0A1G2FXX1_9BACT|nr:MAG: 30S ribosomal protein S13 [Candidatus Ryanbacteria bacterium RIFCSPHIGHO2_01_FULL_44_130]OGZ42925.1 MAG: 30S ribosomal protein S13 [Candidatus Ryanbacteria bacterium RIFCSPHIGHO2_01_45_13]OGZ48630.1 MAG: 30S ribosomal protein S13 [Candidatus Ryanbacteria bacterium RIFCSPHIGHO2_02_FULL_45_43]OGZ50571.1 MAG: 30S ribosomal protein S13 [Candidatus Ryanbacteria bacterium RIFCSPHIGHO2_12_FULL_44_20]OGZ51877.1 MAG: 30S ribosomal protein S13 [Candidatus Ryanbacteria bacterium RIFCSPLOWO2_01_FUL